MAGAEGTLRAITFGSRKMPDPITIPITIRVASTSPSRRGNSSMLYFALLQRDRVLFDIVAHARLGRADVMESFGVLYAVLLAQRAIAGEQKFLDVVAVGCTIVIAQQR